MDFFTLRSGFKKCVYRIHVDDRTKRCTTCLHTEVFPLRHLSSEPDSGPGGLSVSLPAHRSALSAQQSLLNSTCPHFKGTFPLKLRRSFIKPPQNISVRTGQCTWVCVCVCVYYQRSLQVKGQSAGDDGKRDPRLWIDSQRPDQQTTPPLISL